MASRRLIDLHPKLKPLCEQFLAKAEIKLIDVLITCTYRSNDEQDLLYAQGRTAPGRIVTRARGGQSAHNFTIGNIPAAKAFDVVPMIAGRCMWNDDHPAWDELGKIGMELGLDWYGAPESKFFEMAHFQLKE